MAELAVARNNRRRVRLQIATNGLFGFLQQSRRLSGFDGVEMPRNRQRLPVLEIAAAISAVECRLVRAENEAGESVARVADLRHVAPGVGRIERVDADRIAMHAA